MKISLITGLAAGAICGILHFMAITGITTAGGLLYYAPLFIYFASIYFSIKRNATVNHGSQIEFKQALKYGGIAALIGAFGIMIGVFVAFTHTDVPAQLKNMLETHMSKDDIMQILQNTTKQKMFDQSKFFTIPYFLIGFLMTIGASVFIARRKKAV